MSGDGRLAVSASRDHTLKVWDVDSGSELRTLVATPTLSAPWRCADRRLAVSASY